MATQMNRYELQNRYRLTGKLTMLTAFHIGGGKVTSSHSDSPVVLTPEEIPFIPGSSFKGVLRNTIEKLVPALPEEAQLFSCALISLSNQEAKEAEQENRRVCPTSQQRAFALKRRENPGKVKEIAEEIHKKLCNTCQLFGSPFAASRININDLYIPVEEWNGTIQVRDGVVIDRDSEKAKDKLKYDYEVVPASATFNLTITLENVTPQDLLLVSIGLSEFVHGFGTIGGKRSSGLGACRLDNLEVSVLDLALGDKTNQLRAYLLKRELPGKISGQEFLEQHITTMFK